MGDARKMNTPGRNSESSIHTERVFSVLLQEWHPRRVNFYNFSSRPENTIFGRVSAGYAPERTCVAGPKNEDFWRSCMANARKMADLEKIGCPKNGIFGSDILGNMGGSFGYHFRLVDKVGSLTASSSSRHHSRNRVSLAL